MAPDLNRRIPELDGLRGVAILLVLVWHLLPGAMADAPPRVLHLTNSFIRFTWSGVDLFFVLSGFLLGGILLDHSESRHYFTTFYARRFYRILPPYIVMVGVFMLLLRHHADAFAWLFDRPMPLWSYLTFTQNFAMARAGELGAQWLGPTWSLAIEEQFYLVLPLIIRFVPRRTLWLALTVLAVSAPVTRTVLFFTDPHWSASAYVLMPARADALMLGVLAALALRSPAIRAALDGRRTPLYGALVVLSLAVVGLALMHETLASPRMVLYGYSVLALFYTTVLLLAVTGGGTEVIGTALRWPALRCTGTLAYGLYLLHVPMEGMSGWLIPSRALAAVTTLVMTFILAGLSWEYFERPLVQRGHSHDY